MLIHLTNLEFFAHHGLLESEKINGNDFVIDCAVEFDEPKTVIWHMNETIDYVSVYNLIKVRMAKPTKLLETIAQLIVADIFESQMLAKKVTVTIRKMRPPIEDFIGQVGVTIIKKRI